MNVREAKLTAVGEIGSTEVAGTLIDRLDLWTGAVTQKRSAGRGSNGKVELTGIKKLRELILELAVRGKLVEQDPSDEPASVLLERIAEEKARLVKEGKIKKPKKLPPITDNEQPYDLPSGWQATRIGEFITLVSGQHLKGEEYSETPDHGSIPYLTGPAEFGSINPKPTRYTKERRALAQPGDILITCKGSGVGKLNRTDEEIAISRQLMAISPIVANRYYVFLILDSLRESIRERIVGIAIPGISREDINHAIAWLPPLPEQHRIVEKVDELMALCDRLEQQTGDQLEAHEVLVDTLLVALTRSTDAAELAENWARIAEHFDTLFTTEASIDKLKQTILQLAVMGRLVPQDPNDEPASVLLERIAEEKARLVKEGKIKKPKKLPVISNDEITNHIPPGWKAVRVGEFINLVSGQHLKGGEYSEAPDDSSIPYLTGPAEFGIIHPLPTRFTKERRAVALPGDILITCKGSGVGKLNTADQETAISRQLMAISPITVSREYTFLIMDSLRESIRERIVGIAIPGISREDITFAVASLPPLDEQHRIVEKVDELMALCNQLKARLGEAGETRAHLAEAVVEQAVQ